jgi:hypothetical protein
MTLATATVSMTRCLWIYEALESSSRHVAESRDVQGRQTRKKKKQNRVSCYTGDQIYGYSTNCIGVKTAFCLSPTRP